jgi:hypothetical protein
MSRMRGEINCLSQDIKTSSVEKSNYLPQIKSLLWPGFVSRKYVSISKNCDYLTKFKTMEEENEIITSYNYL